MKRGITLGLLFGIFLLSFISSACLNPMQGQTYNTLTTFCNGTFNIDGTNIIISGAVVTCNNTILQGNGSDYQIVMVHPNSVLENCIFLGNGGSDQTVWIGGNNATLRNNSFYNSTVYSVAVGGSNHSFLLVNNTFNNVSYAFYVFNHSGGNFTNNQIVNSIHGILFNDEGGGGANNLTISDNIFTNLLKEAIYLLNSDNNTIKNNNVTLTANTPTYLYRTDKSVLNVSGRICNNSFSQTNATLFVYSGMSTDGITTNNFLLSNNPDQGTHNFGIACANLTLSGGLEDATAFYDTTLWTDCSSIESGLGLNPGDCYFADPNALIAGGLGLNYTFNTSVFNSTVNISAGYLQPRMTVEVGVYYGIKLVNSTGNLIYNNYLNNTHNAYDGIIGNWWNITKTLGTNILGGLYLGGNFFSDYTGQDHTGEGIGSTNYTINVSLGIVDYLPLTNDLNDTTPPYFIDGTPTNQTLVYGTTLSYKINATDIVNLSSFAVNNSRFKISSSGLLENNTILGGGFYLLNITINDTANNLNSTVMFVNVTKATGVVYTYLNGSRANITINNATQILLNTTLTTGVGNVQLYKNGTLIFNGTTPYAGNYTNFTTAGLYNITAIYLVNENYTASSETFYVTSDATPPQVNISSPTATTYTTSSILFNVTTNENSTCNFTTDSGVINYSMTANASGTLFNYTKTGFTSASYTSKFYCWDSVENLNSTQNVSFTVCIPDSSCAASTCSGSTCTSCGTVYSGTKSCSSGGGGGEAPTWANTFIPLESELNNGYTKEVPVNNRVAFKIDKESHYLGVKSLLVNTITLEVASIPVQITLSIGNDKKVDVNTDGYYDVYVKLLNISNNKANLFIQKIHEVIPVVTPTPEPETGIGTQIKEAGENIAENVEKAAEGKASPWVYVILVAIIILVIAFLLLRVGRKNRHKEYGY